MNGKVKMHTNFNPLKKLQAKSPALFRKAMEKGAVQFLNWANTGSAQESRKPPIRWGVLRGSSSAFVGNKLVAIFPQNITGEGEAATPAQSSIPVAADVYAIWVWNTDYATKMHEWKGGWGKFTTQDRNAGNKWLEMHLKADKNALMKMIASQFKKEAKM